MKENTKKQPIEKPQTEKQKAVDAAITDIIENERTFYFATEVVAAYGVTINSLKTHKRYKELRNYLDIQCESVVDKADSVLIRKLNSGEASERTLEVAYRRFGDIELRKKMNGVIVDVAIQQQQDEFGALARTFFGAPDKEADK